MGIDFVFCFLLVIAAVVARVLSLSIYRKRLSAGLIGDAAGHYSFIRALKEAKGKYKGVPEWLIADGDDHYPIMFHRLAALLPLRILERYPFLPNIFVFGFAIASFVVGMGLGILGSSGQDITVISVSVLLIFSLPGNTVLTGDSILYAGLSERSMARLFTSIYFLGAFGFVQYGGWEILVYASVFGGLSLCTALFARQAVLFASFIWFLLSGTLNVLYPLIGAVLVALVIDRSYFVLGVADQINYLKVYSRRMKTSRYWGKALSRFIDWKRVVSIKNTLVDKKEELEKREPTQSLFKCPEIYVISLILILNNNDESNFYISSLIVSIFLLYLLISTPMLRHLGEAVRYPEYVFGFLAPGWLSVYWVNADFSNWDIAIVFGYIFFVFIIFCLNISTIKKESVAKDHWSELWKCLELAHIKPEHGLFTVPFSLGWVCSAATRCRSLAFQGSSFNVELYDQFFDEFPFLKKDWKCLAEEYDLTHVVVRKAELDAQLSSLGWTYDFGDLGEPLTVGGFSIYRIQLEKQHSEGSTKG